MKNLIKYDYVPISKVFDPSTISDHDKKRWYPNLEAEVLKDPAHHGKSIGRQKVHLGILDLYRSLVDKRPNWNYVVHSECRRSGSLRADLQFDRLKMDVLDIYGNGELLGSVERSWNGTHYEIKNFRMSRKLRKRTPKGFSIPAMTKRILKDFRPRNNEEQMEQATSTTSAFYRDVLSELCYPWKHLRNSYDSKVFTEIAKNWDKYKDILSKVNVPENGKELYDQFAWHEENAGRLQDKNLVIILERDDGSYLVSGETDGSVRVADTLEGELRTKVGLLKVAPPETLLKDIGFRKDNVFRIFKAKEDTDGRTAP